MKSQVKSHVTLAVIIYSLLAIVTILCVPNIKIQVNNENLQRPPYLLEAIKRATAIADAEQNANNPQVSATDSASSDSAKIKSENAPEGHSSATDGADSGTYSVVKEETIEEILDLEPESVLKLSPESLISAVSPQDYSKLSGDMVASSSNIDESIDRSSIQPGSSNSVSMKQESRGPQLAVTNSHLKRPTVGVIDGDEKQTASSETTTSHGTGAKSLVSPSVAADEPPPVNNQRKNIPNPPDTLELSQVMAGAANASMVPATVKREYGHNSRTKITVGGGYVRDRLPALNNPTTSEYREDKIEKSQSQSPHTAERPDKSLLETSKVIEVPEKIILPASIFDQPMRQPSNKIATTVETMVNVTKGKQDSRCPVRGVMTFEHPSACDKYFLCDDGYLIEQTCPNGLLYGTRDMVKDYCVHRWQVVCGDKKIPNPISSPGCRWQYGIFSVQGSPRCTPDFYECVAGSFEVRKCSVSGQVYDDRTKSCQFAEKVGCAEEALADFTCPPDDQGNTYWPFPRYFLNDRSIIHCVNDKPAIIRCRDDERVDPEHLHCVALSKSDTSNSDAGDSLVSRKSREKMAPKNN